MSEPDVIADILQRITASTKVPAKVVQKVEAEARQHWGGDRHYIREVGEAPRRREASDRAKRIFAEHRRGDHVALLARRHGMSARRVQQIIKSIKAIQNPAANDDPLQAEAVTEPSLFLALGNGAE